VALPLTFVSSHDVVQCFVSDLMGENYTAMLIAQYCFAAYDYRWEIRASLSMSSARF